MPDGGTPERRGERDPAGPRTAPRRSLRSLGSAGNYGPKVLPHFTTQAPQTPSDPPTLPRRSGEPRTSPVPGADSGSSVPTARPPGGRTIKRSAGPLRTDFGAGRGAHSPTPYFCLLVGIQRAMAATSPRGGGKAAAATAPGTPGAAARSCAPRAPPPCSAQLRRLRGPRPCLPHGTAPPAVTCWAAGHPSRRRPGPSRRPRPPPAGAAPESRRGRPASPALRAPRRGSARSLGTASRGSGRIASFLRFALQQAAPRREVSWPRLPEAALQALGTAWRRRSQSSN